MIAVREQGAADHQTALFGDSHAFTGRVPRALDMFQHVEAEHDVIAFVRNLRAGADVGGQNFRIARRNVGASIVAILGEVLARSIAGAEIEKAWNPAFGSAGPDQVLDHPHDHGVAIADIVDPGRVPAEIGQVPEGLPKDPADVDAGIEELVLALQNLLLRRLPVARYVKKIKGAAGKFLAGQ